MLTKNHGMSPVVPVLLVVASLVQGMVCVEYIVTNNAPKTIGGQRFDKEIGIPTAVRIAREVNEFIWKVFKQNSPAQRKNVPVVHITITTLDTGSYAQVVGNTVYIDTDAIQDHFPVDGAQFEFTSLLFTFMTRIFEWSGKGTPQGLTIGIGDYVKVKSNYYHPNTYAKPGEGNRWDDGYGVTARFLEYCDTLRPAFVADLNDKMRQEFKLEYFRDLLGKSVDQLWGEYKAKYGR